MTHHLLSGILSNIGINEEIKIIKSVICKIKTILNQNKEGNELLDHLRILLEMIRYHNDSDFFCKKTELKSLNDLNDIYQGIFENVSLLVFFQISNQNKKDERELLHVNCDLVIFCIKICPSESLKMTETCVDLCKHSLSTYYNDLKHGFGQSVKGDHLLDPQCAVELLNHILNNINDLNLQKKDVIQLCDSIIPIAFDVLLYCNESLGYHIITFILPKLFDNTNISKEQGLELLLIAGKKCFISSESVIKEVNSVGYLILCSVIEYSISDKNSRNMEHFTNFAKQDIIWQIIQLGLVHSNPLNRKRSTYILTKVIEFCKSENLQKNIYEKWSPMFCWKSEENKLLSKLWSDFILIIDTLEEKQVHVIKPVLPRLEGLLKTSTANGDFAHLHISWISVLFHRTFLHESKFINRWGIHCFLNMDLSEEHLINHQIDKFIVHVLLPLLNDPSLYMRTEDDRSRSPTIALSLNLFLQKCYHLMPFQNSVNFYRSFIHQMKLHTWSSVALFYVAQGLSKLPQANIWNNESLFDLRELIKNTLRTQEVLIRGAIQCCLLKALMQILDWGNIDFSSLSLTLTAFRNDECLRRGTSLWSDVAKWLAENFNLLFSTIDEAVELFNHHIKSLLESPLVVNEEDSSKLIMDSAESKRLARMMILLLDACKDIKMNDEDFSFNLMSSFGIIKDILTTMNYRPYLSSGKIDHCLQFLFVAIEELNINKEKDQDDIQVSFLNWLRPCLDPIIQYLIRKLPDDIRTMQDLDRLDLYLNCLERIADLPGCSFVQDLSHFCESCLQTLESNEVDLESQLKKYASMKCLAWICHYQESDPKTVGSSELDTIFDFIQKQISLNLLSKPLQKNENSELNALYQNQWGYIVSDYISTFWKCASFYLKNHHTSENCVKIAEQSLLAVELGANVVPEVCLSLKYILPKLLQRNENLFQQVIDCCWKCAFEQRKNERFWISMEAFVNMVFQPTILMNEKSQLLKDHSDELYMMGDSCPNIFHLFSVHCCQIWQTNPLCLIHHLEFFVNSLIFGPVHRKDLRVINDTSSYIVSLGSREFTVIDLVKSDHLNDVQVRAAAISVILTLTANLLWRNRLAWEVFTKLMEKDQIISNSRSRYFANSLIHRMKNRIWQLVLIIEPFLSQENLEYILDIIFAELMKESVQPSIRFLLEWTAVRIFHHSSHLKNLLWINLEKASTVRVGSVGSFLCIAYHLAVAITEVESKEEFILESLPLILPWCMAQNFNTRVTAQVILHYLWKMSEEYHLEKVLQTYHSIRVCFDFMTENKNASRNIQKLMNDFYFTVFHPVKHYTLQAIFYDLPRLFHIIEDEWIHPNIFIEINPSLKQQETMNLLHGDSNDLASCVIAGWLLKAGGSGMEETTEEGILFTGNVQKKIIPWKQLIADQDQGSLLVDNSPSSNPQGLIVVASLIDRAPNLGGLCRTCEIFGVSEYVLGSLKFIEDKQFQQLSVTAEKWITITEVKAHELKTYLMSKQQEGYTLVGVEQTAHSHTLQKYQFEKKTLLLLGNEKEGIPVDLIHILDACIEIPQQGVIRSLNVHVSGALIIWEYARQHLNQQ